MNIIDVQGLTKRFGQRTVVDHIDLQVRKGEILGFLGPNGSGKTTSIRLICGLLTPDEGEGRVLGYNVRTQSAAIKLKSGYMTQRFSFYEDLTIAENLAFVARLYHMPVKQSVAHALARLGLENRAHQLAGTLSGGWKQRLALAACILHQPELLLLDEPTAGVDPKARREFWDEIHQLAADGLTVLVSTHYMDEAERCHRINYISNGRMIASGSVENVVASAGLITFVLNGKNITQLQDHIRNLSAVEQVAPFGTSLHVVGRDEAALKTQLTAFAKQYHLNLSRGETSLEDVFIHLMGESQA